MDAKIAAVEGKLTALGIAHKTERHAAAATVDDMLVALAALAGTKCKNLFIKAKKERDPTDTRMWLVIAAANADTNLNSLAAKLGYGKIVLRFGDAESLLDNLGTVQGHVSPFALLHDTALQVNVAVDSRLLVDAAGPLYFHPLTNEASTAISPADLRRFIESTGHKITTVDFDVK